MKVFADDYARLKMVKLYRFEKLEDKRLDTIANGQLWIASPSTFNDLDDCRIRGLYVGVDDDKHHERISNSLNNLYNDSNKYPFGDNLYKSIKAYTNSSLKDKTELSKNILNGLDLSASVSSIRAEIINNVLVSCFFEGDSNNSLMWAHYANNHKGFCIEYELQQAAPEVFGFNRVNYVSLLPEIYATELLFNPHETIARIVYSKSLEWSYEREWRYVEYQNTKTILKGKRVRMPSNLKPTRIITGARFADNDDAKLIAKLMQVAGELGINVIPKKSSLTKNLG